MIYLISFISAMSFSLGVIYLLDSATYKKKEEVFEAIVMFVFGGLLIYVSFFCLLLFITTI